MIPTAESTIPKNVSLPTSQGNSLNKEKPNDMTHNSVNNNIQYLHLLSIRIYSLESLLIKVNLVFKHGRRERS